LSDHSTKAPVVPDGVVEDVHDETLITPLDVPFEENQHAFLRKRHAAHDLPPTQTIFPKA
jgi:hypothetical protein